LKAKDFERIQMRKDFDLEYEVLSAIIKQKDASLAETKEAM